MKLLVVYKQYYVTDPVEIFVALLCRSNRRLIGKGYNVCVSRNPEMYSLL